MRQIINILIISIFLSLCFVSYAENIKVVKNKSTNEIILRQIPNFEDGKGIKLVVSRHGGKTEDYEEVTMSQEEWDNQIKQIKDKDEKKKKDKDTAIEKLKTLGLTEDEAKAISD